MNALIKESKSDSLLIGGNRATSKLVNKLEQRIRKFDDKALFITLTYRHEDFVNPLHLYRSQRENRHIRLFIRRLSHYLGCSLNGKWVRKLEFQKGGWVHFHLIIDSPKFIPHDDLTDIWGHGFTWINSCKWEHLKYFCKYIAKSIDDALCPAFLMLERSRSVKIVACSPNFWGETPKSHKVFKEKSIQWAVYIPVRESFQPKTILKTSEGQKTIHASIFVVLNQLLSNGSMLMGTQDEYISLASSHNAIHNTLNHFDEIVATVPPVSPPAGVGEPVDVLLDNGGNSAHVNSTESVRELPQVYRDWELEFLKQAGIFHERVNHYA